MAAETDAIESSYTSVLAPVSFRVHGIQTDVVEASPGVVAIASKHFYFTNCRVGMALLGRRRSSTASPLVQGSREFMRSVCQALNLLTTTLGSVVAGGVNSIFSVWVTTNLNDGSLELVFYTLAGLVVLNLLGFVLVARGFEYHVPDHLKLDLVSGYSPALPRATRRSRKPSGVV
ncbi:hypothetical protein SPRG_02669 [Saprolegnia parasitica CBS 223.65]|uniref:Uncharacterized protein n=1 Tax=Saprolegnia parasitica (strain CBS 223.65) TaxID=695850 RepID=A0A067CR28_SAPPC|nr:hypothetical protein SPRG_02669 [Saprolegnia parasitica CBS 223.65]KDO32978.1 hypothetical protein SPRG_02669 [Saprolegnia parasitica CBS 223.65]|eukprot:XP_012196623.1 hypothetical protein SPRG_02669 [Saprolegnia parasitica CBS 223.65]